jgi:hypothetical protein
MRKSVDKCSGDGCICKELKPRVITEVKIQSISIDSGPSIFPGAGGITMVEAGQALVRANSIFPSTEDVVARVHRERAQYMAQRQITQKHKRRGW